jgi:hypothetical protein
MAKWLKKVKLKISELYLYLQLKLLNNQLDYEADQAFKRRGEGDEPDSQHEHVLRLYKAAMVRVKGKIRDMAKQRYNGDLDAALRSQPNLVDLALEETDSERELREVRESIIEFKSEDPNDPDVQRRRLDKRMQLRYSATMQKEERELMKALRVANTKRDFKEAQRIKEEWKIKFGK